MIWYEVVWKAAEENKFGWNIGLAGMRSLCPKRRKGGSAAKPVSPVSPKYFSDQGNHGHLTPGSNSPTISQTVRLGADESFLRPADTGAAVTFTTQGIFMTTVQALVACSDLTGFAKLTIKWTEEDVFHFLSDYYEFVGEIMEPAGGKVVKFMGDAALMLFPEPHVDSGVRSLLRLQSEGDRFMNNRGISCRHHIRAHFGPVQQGALGTRTDKRLDIIGATVNTVFLLRSTGFGITPEAFRKLHPDTRTLFKKHTPPVTYIPTGHPHKD